MNPGLLPGLTGQNGQLGTDGFDFMTYLLGLQANQGSEWWQTGTEGSGLFQLPTDDANLKSGQDATLSPADQLAALLTPVVWNNGMPQGDSGMEGSLAPNLSSVSAPPSELGRNPSSVAELLQSSPEDMNPVQLKQLVDIVWGNATEVRSVDFEPIQADTPSKVGTSAKAIRAEDDSQHALMRAMAVRNAESAAAKAGGEDRFEVPGLRLEGLDEAAFKPTDRDEKKGLRWESGDAFASLVTDTRLDSGPAIDSGVSETGKTEVTAPTHAKLMPQVLPRVENLVEQGGGKATIQLDPPEMGRLTIEVTTRGKHVELAIHSDRESTKAILETGMADLQVALQTHDLQLTKSEVHATHESSFSAMNFGQQAKEGRGESSQSQQDGYRSFHKQEVQEWSRSLLTENPVARTRNAGRLDVRV